MNQYFYSKVSSIFIYKKKGTPKSSLTLYHPMDGAVKATEVV
jgi:hypothetical protein